jgi:protein-S-isoprenylcysteine O-methyltransferase Ste14
MESSFVLLIVAFLACLFVRTGYELLKEAGKVNPESRLIFAIILTVMCALWASWFTLCPLDPSPVNMPDAVRWGGFVLFGLGMVLAVGALVHLRGVENINHLVTTGLFTNIRHPMYAGFVLWILGWSIYHGAMVSLAVGLIGIANILYWRRLEEVRLLARYGDTYRLYRLTTWF